MKYLEEPQLSWLNAVLGSYSVGDRVLTGKLETYSCKKAGSDKRLAKQLERSYQQEMELSCSEARPLPLSSSSSLGPLAAAATRKLLITLISTMNASFPDYDFSGVRPDQFCKVIDFRSALQRINHDLAELLDAEGDGFVEKMWESVAEVIKLDDCDVYSYIPDMDSDPFSDGHLWSFNYFFYNKVQKKVLYFTCICKGSTYDTATDDEVMEESVAMEDDGEDDMEDYFGMSPDWEDGL
ncbi:unnamed protein product [Hyaloperonospora brassicae]|uniref:Repressor of RNA polymerase III transcription n=1 Tax=Hyaloperonospora brassicae TaxID=162125 RepID=A0AAV0TIU4_HYABA|nr:unnamed protein product [Hyaloperonospora brassicae]